MGLIQRLNAKHVRVVGVDLSPLSSGLYLVDKGYVVPRGDDPHFLEEMLRISSREHASMIISGPEEEILTLSRNKQSFGNTLVLCPEFETARLCANKIETYEKLRLLGISIPQIYNQDEVVFPCIVKPASGRGSRGVYKAENSDELEMFRPRIQNPLVQEFLSGRECSVDTLADLNGKPLSIVPRFRLEVESGVAIRGVTFYDEELIRTCKRIVEEFRLMGPACIQCIECEGKFKFTEVNTRFGGGSILSMEADPSIVSNIVRMARRKKPIPSKGFASGLVMLTYYSTVFVLEARLKGRQIRYED
jgi:carbamoyl-phosphate synthase large subunit